MSKQPPAEKIKRLFDNSVERLRVGDAGGAAKGFEKLVKAIPQSAAAWYNLALSQQHLGRHAKAAQAYRRVLRLDDGNAEAVINLGLSQKELGEVDAAMQSARSALEIAPDHARALNLIGTLHAEQGADDLAEAAFRRALEHVPDNADARHNLANARLRAGDAAAALELAQPLLASDARAKRHRLLHGQILLELKRYGEASAAVDDLAAQFGDDSEVLLLRMSLHELTKDYFGVIEAATRLLERKADTSIDFARVWNSLGSAYFQLDGIDKAADCYRAAIERAPDHAEYQNNRGLVHSSKGEKRDAERCYRRAIELSPQYAEAYRNLVAMKKFESLDDADAVAIESLWRRDDLDDFTRTKLAFALGKVYDDVGEYARAFEVYEVGNRLKFAESKLDFDRYFSHIDAVTEVFTERPRQSSEATVSPNPIFIVGMPRSGTTLAEQIIARHPTVSGCGELPCIEKAIARLEKRADPMRVYPRDFIDLGADALSGETRHYLSWVKRLHDDLATDFITDKMPFNFVHLWLIKALFPRAVIIHCHRHPLDVITSNYFQMYASDISFVYDLEVLSRYYVRYYRLMRHWRRVFGDEIYTLQYETLVGDQEAQTRKLIEAAKLPWDDACLDLRKSETAVRTASIWQVRQGIYTSSRERWRNYQRELAPAIEILQQEGVIDAQLNDLGG
ncbi:MAG: tetratricopeptide repeat-containing sulfotransferase family protein [bacterium]